VPLRNVSGAALDWVLFQPKSGKFTSPVWRFFIRTVRRSIPHTTPVMYVLSRIPGNPLPLREPRGAYVICLFMSAHAVLQGGFAKQSMAYYQPSEI
jgi:hypothetical protein